MDGYLTSEGGEVNIARVMNVFKQLARVEGQILKRRR